MYYVTLFKTISLKNIVAVFLFVTLLFFGFGMSVISVNSTVFAQGAGENESEGSEITGENESEGSEITGENESEGSEDFSKLKNPLAGTVDDLPGFVQTILDVVLLIGVPLVALAIIYSGLKFVTAQGNPEKLKDAKKAFLFTLVGAAIVLGAFVIANAIGGTIKELQA